MQSRTGIVASQGNAERSRSPTQLVCSAVFWNRKKCFQSRSEEIKRGRIGRDNRTKKRESSHCKNHCQWRDFFGSCWQMMQLCLTTSRNNNGHRLNIAVLSCGHGWNRYEWPGLSVADLVAQFLPIPTLQVCKCSTAHHKQPTDLAS